MYVCYGTDFFHFLSNLNAASSHVQTSHVFTYLTYSHSFTHSFVRSIINVSNVHTLTYVQVTEFGPMVNILVSQCKSLERTHRLAALKWIYEFIILGKTRCVLFHFVSFAALVKLMSVFSVIYSPANFFSFFSFSVTHWDHCKFPFLR